MNFVKFFLVFVTFIGTTCAEKIIPNDTSDLTELEEAAIEILTTCYKNDDNTIAILGEHYGNFLSKLSTYKSFSLLLLDDRRRAENNYGYWSDYHSSNDWNKRNINKKRKVHIIVMMVPNYQRFIQMLMTFERSPYFNSAGSILIIGWSSINKYASCDGQLQTFLLLQMANLYNFLNANYLCRNRKMGLVLYGFHPYSNLPRESWFFVNSVNFVRGMHDVSFFVRQYRKDKKICKNLNFEKTQDLDGSPIITVETCALGHFCKGKRKSTQIKNQVWFEERRHFDFIDNFINYVNASRKYVYYHPREGIIVTEAETGIKTAPYFLLHRIDRYAHTYPHGRECVFLVSQFRGNKSQLEKIYSVIDRYSWIGICITYLITIIFFKYFLFQSVMKGIVNLVRLSFGYGLTREPLNSSACIYIGCLYFFVVTMQGIIFGNLASLLIHDSPVRQIRSINDLADLNYTVYASLMHFNYFEDSVFKGRVFEKIEHGNCIKYVKRDPFVACLTWGSRDTVEAINSNLYISPDCISELYIVNIFQWQWFLEKKINKFLGMLKGGGIMMDLEALVYEQNLLEIQSKIIDEEPTKMHLNTLGFAFALLGIGWGFASITFILEIMISRFQNRVTSRVIAIN